MNRYATVALCILMLAGCSSVVDEGHYKVNQVADLKDQDSDGVINARDKCADTELGSLVDNDGCPTQSALDTVQDLHVLFDHDKDVVKPEFFPNIASMATFMRSHTDMTLVMEGHASQVGTDEHNQALSLRRAAAVKHIMVSEHGIAADRVILKPFAATHPAVLGQDEPAHSANRRVVGSLAATNSELVRKWTVFSVSKGF